MMITSEFLRAYQSRPSCITIVLHRNQAPHIHMKLDVQGNRPIRWRHWAKWARHGCHSPDHRTNRYQANWASKYSRWSHTHWGSCFEYLDAQLAWYLLVRWSGEWHPCRSEEHTSELQSHSDLVC